MVCARPRCRCGCSARRDCDALVGEAAPVASPVMEFRTEPFENFYDVFEEIGT